MVPKYEDQDVTAWFFAAIAATVVCLAGCQQAAAPAPAPAPPAPSGNVSHSLSVEVPANVVVAIHRYLGDKNTITLAQPLTVRQESLSVAMPAGASVSYTLSDQEGTVIFNAPKPRLTASLAGFPIHPELDQIDLKAPASGVAHVRELGREFKVNFPLNPEAVGIVVGAAQKAEVPVVPKVYFWHSGKSCAFCLLAEEAFEKEKKAGKLPFEYVLNPTDVKSVVQIEAYPHFEWSGADGKTHWQTGWEGYDKFKKTWEASQKKKGG